jgi:hypothetical protein
MFSVCMILNNPKVAWIEPKHVAVIVVFTVSICVLRLIVYNFVERESLRHQHTEPWTLWILSSNFACNDTESTYDIMLVDLMLLKLDLRLNTTS